MSTADEKIQRLTDAVLAWCDAMDMATQTFRNSIGKPQPHATTKTDSTNILSNFPEDLQQYLTVETYPEGWHVKNRYVSADLWNRMNTAAKAIGGVWSGEGKNKYWLIPKKA